MEISKLSQILNRASQLYSERWLRVRADLADESGATAVEYALIAGLIAAVLITALTDTGTNVRTLFETVAAAIP